MMRLILIFIMCFSLTSLRSQNIEMGGGLNRNTFYCTTPNDWHFETNYKAENGYSIFVSLEDTIFHSLFSKFIFTFDNYNGYLHTTDGGLSGASTTIADVNKVTLGLTFFPLNFKIAKACWLNFGAACNFLLNQKMMGYHSWWHNSSSATGGIDIIDEHSNAYANRFTLGLAARAAGEIKINSTWFIVPQILIYLGLSNEFSHQVEANSKSFRQTYAIGIMKKISRRKPAYN